MRHYRTTSAAQSDLFDAKVEPVAGERLCGGCKRVLPITAFSWNAHVNGRSYRTSRCRDCKARSSREWNVRRRKTKVLNRKLIDAFGLTLDGYKALLAAQGGVCVICGKPAKGTDRRNQRLHVDHCHSCDHVRALLCSPCNRGLGCFGDNPQLVQKAADYLAAHRCRGAKS